MWTETILAEEEKIFSTSQNMYKIKLIVLNCLFSGAKEILRAKSASGKEYEFSVYEDKSRNEVKICVEKIKEENDPKPYPMIARISNPCFNEPFDKKFYVEKALRWCLKDDKNLSPETEEILAIARDYQWIL